MPVSKWSLLAACIFAFVCVQELRADPQPSVRIVAHRGLLKHSPENTLSNFKACLALRLGFEFDVRWSRDRVLVCVHDATLDRTTNGRGAVSDRALAELKQLDAGRWFGESFRGERVPTIEQILATVHDEARDNTLIAVDLKDADVEADVVRIAKKLAVLDQLLFIGTSIENAEVRRRLRAADAGTHVGCLAGTREALAAAIDDKHSDWAYLRFVPTADEVAKIHAAGKKVFIAGPTVAGKETRNWEAAIAAGVDGVLTDYPLELAETRKAAELNRNTQAKESAMDNQFERLAARFVDELPGLSPVGATSMGDHRYDHLMDEVSPEARGRRKAFYQRFAKELESIEPARLSRENQVDHRLLDHHLRKGLWELETLQEWAWNPVAYTQLTGSGIYGLMARDFAPLQTRLKKTTQRLREYPRLFRQIRDTLQPKRVPSIHAETAIRQNRGVLSILEQRVRPHIDVLNPADRKELEQAIEATEAAVEEHQKWLEKELLPHAGGDFRLGPDLFEQKLKLTLGTGIGRVELRERAELELKRTRQEMYGISRDFLLKENPDADWPESPTPETMQRAIETALERANRDVPPRDGIVAAAEKSLRLATDFIRQRDLMTIPSDPLEIIIMPEFERGVSVAYCDSPGPLEVGQKTFYAVSPLPDDWNDEQCRSFLREYNHRSIHNLTIHEAMPGHFVQIAMGNRNERRLRSVLSSGVFVEGWACYTERMMAEEGFLDADPLMRLIALKWALRTIGNSILDQAVHVDGIRREEAMRLMTKDTFQEEREAAGKWVRAQLTSAQLSTYFVGVQEHLDMRKAARTAWGRDFSLKRYHDGVVSFGSPPTRFVRALLLDQPIP